MKGKREVDRAIALIVTVLLVATAAFGQQTSPSPSPRTKPEVAAPAQNQSQTVPPSNGLPQPSAGAPGSAIASYLTPIHGTQGVLAQTLVGATLAAQSVDDKFNPASSIKLATALAALKAFGPDYRFVTSVWATGTIDQATGNLNGDLIITGRDPSLHYEHAVMLARQLNQMGIRTVSGNLIFAPGFTMNFDWSGQHSAEQFRDTLDTARRSASALRVWTDERTLMGDTESLRSIPSVLVAGEVRLGSAPPEARVLITHKSSKLVDILKVLLCYSNNFMAERIGETIGGPQAVRALLIDRLKINPDELLISTASGLGVNRVTPRAMMTILRGLREELQRNKLSLSDILPVAGIDPGTLEDRYTDQAVRGSVIAKTGTLGRTDGGASSLVGQMQTRSGRIVLFVILNQHGNVLSFRQNQDQIVASIQNALGGPAPFAYKPVTLALRLADSDYEAAKARGEYEPRDRQ